MSTPRERVREFLHAWDDTYRGDFSRTIWSLYGGKARLLAADVRALAEEEPLRMVGSEFTAGASDEPEWCGCGEPITEYDGEWLHIINPVLRGTDDHDAHPG